MERDIVNWNRKVYKGLFYNTELQLRCQHYFGMKFTFTFVYITCLLSSCLLLEFSPFPALHKLPLSNRPRRHASSFSRS